MTSPVWRHFYKGTNKYKTDTFHYEVWCKACTDAAVERIVSAELNGAGDGRRVARTEEEIRVTCKCSIMSTFDGCDLVVVSERFIEGNVGQNPRYVEAP
jgi:hypothetical protein